jgi:xylulokinase
MNILSLDVGTTCCKCQLFDADGNVLFYRSEECPLKKIDGLRYIDIDNMLKLVKSLISTAAKTDSVDSIAISSFGETFVLMDDKDNILFNPMLYTDPRGTDQAHRIGEEFPAERFYRTTGTLPHGMYSVSKLLWIRDTHPELFFKAKKLLLICDYIGYVLTGERVIDYGLASRSGVFDIRKKRFDPHILSALDIPLSLFSEPRPAGCPVKKIRSKIADELGLKKNCVLILGSHDQICAALGAGVLEEDKAADGMGTVECVTSMLDDAPDDIETGRLGYSVIPYAIDGRYCTYIVNYTGCSLIDWFRKDILHGYSGGKKSFFSYIEESIKDAPSDIAVIPRFAESKGAILNLSSNTTDAEIYRAILEGAALEMRFILETSRRLGIVPKRLVATGGGANSKLWLQIKADSSGLEITTLRSHESGLCGAAMLQSVAVGICADLKEAAKIFVKYKETFLPRPEFKSLYDEKYKKYAVLRQIIKESNEK